MSKYEISISAPNRPDGDPIEVPPAGLVPNGGSIIAEIPDEEYDRIKGSTDSIVSIKKAPASAEVTPQEIPQVVVPTVEETTTEVEEGGEA